MTVMAPADENECRQMLYTAFTLDTPAAVRYPRGSGPGVAVQKEMSALPIGRGEVRRERGAKRGGDPRLRQRAPPALEAGEELDATVVNMRFVKPLDDALVVQLARTHALLVTVEENVVMGGAGSAVAEASPRPASPSRCCTSACPTASSTTATRTSCSPLRPRRERHRRAVSPASARCGPRWSRSRRHAAPRGGRQGARGVIPGQIDGQAIAAGRPMERRSRFDEGADAGERDPDRTSAKIRAMNRPTRAAPVPDARHAIRARRAADRHRQGRHQGAQVSAAVRRPGRRRAADGRRLQRHRRAAGRPEGHAHVAPGRAARDAHRAGRSRR